MHSYRLIYCAVQSDPGYRMILCRGEGTIFRVLLGRNFVYDPHTLKPETPHPLNKPQTLVLPDQTNFRRL